ncbi:MAG: hypothetical protein R3A10_09715 [Caldilineaceae bacterium]
MRRCVTPASMWAKYWLNPAPMCGEISTTPRVFSHRGSGPVTWLSG